jgi:hypothetical protein
LLGHAAARKRERGSASGPTSWAEPKGERGEIGPVQFLILFFFFKLMNSATICLFL